jgi:hypothetical protein
MRATSSNTNSADAKRLILLSYLHSERIRGVGIQDTHDMTLL